MKRALELNASALLLVHNRPSGDPTPSRGHRYDAQGQGCGRGGGLTLHDHVIVSRGGAKSFKSDGVM